MVPITLHSHQNRPHNPRTMFYLPKHSVRVLKATSRPEMGQTRATYMSEFDSSPRSMYDRGDEPGGKPVIVVVQVVL